MKYFRGGRAMMCDSSLLGPPDWSSALVVELRMGQTWHTPMERNMYRRQQIHR
jgi:hypothetical protein